MQPILERFLSLDNPWNASDLDYLLVHRLAYNDDVVAHFQRNPPGRGQLAVFPRCSLDPYESRYGRFARALKNSQLTCGDLTIICETVH
jgi:hypothetical protein